MMYITPNYRWQTDALNVTAAAPCSTVTIASRFVPLPELAKFITDGWTDTGARIVGVGGAPLAHLTKTVTSYSNVTPPESAGGA